MLRISPTVPPGSFRTNSASSPLASPDNSSRSQVSTISKKPRSAWSRSITVAPGSMSASTGYGVIKRWQKTVDGRTSDFVNCLIRGGKMAPLIVGQPIW